MAINFPDNPNTNDTYTYGSRAWVYTGSAWKAAASNTSPISVAAGGTSASTAANARVNLGLEIGVDVQEYSSSLTAVGQLTPTDSNFIVGNGTTWVTETGSTARTSLGLGTIATQDSDSISISGGSATLTSLDTTTANITTASITTASITTANVSNTVVFAGEYDNGNSSTAATIDFNNGQKQKITLTGACTLTFTAPPGTGNFLLKLVQDGTGSRTVTWPATVKWAGAAAPELTTAAGNVDIATFYYDGTNYYGAASLDFA